MSIKKRGLGKSLSEMGVEALLSPSLTRDTHSVEQEGFSSATLTLLPIHFLKPGRYQPRRRIDPDTLEELARSIETQGIIQPIIVRPLGEHYEIIAGERRWLAAQKANLHEVPVVIREIDDEATLAMSLIENIQREDLNVIEEAMALQRLLTDFSMTHQEIATAIGRSRTSVTNVLRLLKLNPEVITLLEERSLDMGHARALLALEGVVQNDTAKKIVAQSLSVRETELLIQSIIKKTQAHTEPAPELAPEQLDIEHDFRDLQKKLEYRLGFSVKIKQNRRGKGKLVINYKGTDQLEKILHYFMED